MAKTTFKLGDIEIAVNGNPVTIKGFEFTTEATAQELATSGSNINKLVKLIGDIANEFDNRTPVVEEIKEIKDEPKSVKIEHITDFREVKEEKPELPTATFSGGEPVKKSFNITKAWRAIPVPEELKPDGTDKFRWESEKGLFGDSVSVNGQTYGVVYIHVYGMRQKSFISVRSENVKFEDDIRPEDFNEFLETINVPQGIKDYIKKVIEL